MTWENDPEKNPDRNTLRNCLSKCLRNSVWRDCVMTIPRRSRASVNRFERPSAREGDPLPLLRRLGEAGLDPDELQRLPRAREARFGVLAKQSRRGQRAALSLLALLEPELRSICRHLVRFGVDAEEAQSLTLSVAWEVVSGHRGRRAPGSRRALANAIWAEVRRDAGVRRGGATATVSLPEGFDVAGAESGPSERWPALLADAVAAGVITARQAVLVAETRIEDRPLGEVAQALGRTYEAVRKERSRAQAALRTFAPSYLSGGGS
jgi:DNA-directed RNA polymerase specialized sigma24 family protein